MKRTGRARTGAQKHGPKRLDLIRIPRLSLVALLRFELSVSTDGRASSVRLVTALQAARISRSGSLRMNHVCTLGGARSALFGRGRP